jgi:hypothetical protein
VLISLKLIDAPSMSLETLIRLREREANESGHSLRDLRHRYVDNLATYVARITNEKARKSDAREIERQFADDMNADLKNLRKELGFARKDAVLSKEVLVTALAAVGTVASWVFSSPGFLPGVTTTAGVPATVGGLLAARNKYLSARHSIMQSHPMAYLYEVSRASE